MKKITWIFLVFLLVFAYAEFKGGRIAPTNVAAVRDCVGLFEKTLKLVSKDYVDDVDLYKIVYPALKALVSQIDPNSYFYTPEENRERQESLKDIQKYSGIGVVIGFRERRHINFDIHVAAIEIKKVYDNSPAKAVGLLPKDEIIAVDGVLVKDIGNDIEKLNEVVKKILGSEGTKVVLKIKRNGWSRPRDFILTRAKVEARNVEWEILSSGSAADREKFGYLKIKSFSVASTSQEVGKAMKDFSAEPDLVGVILDLRGNLGGLLNITVDVLEYFLPADTLVIYEKGRSGEEWIKTRATYKDYYAKPLVVLIDDYSASASEIVAGVLRVHKRAVLIGETTYGKGTVQYFYEFSGGSAVRFTARRYFLPNGESIQGKGIKPHLEFPVEYSEPIISEAMTVIKNWNKYKEKFLK